MTIVFNKPCNLRNPSKGVTLLFDKGEELEVLAVMGTKEPGKCELVLDNWNPAVRDYLADVDRDMFWVKEE